jgi:hypothetical protein
MSAIVTPFDISKLFESEEKTSTARPLPEDYNASKMLYTMNRQQNAGE